MYLKECQERSETFNEDMYALIHANHIEIKRSVEFGPQIIHSIVTGVPRVIHGNVINNNIITNLPYECCVEVACLVDKNGIQPTYVGNLPAQLAALIRTNINVQELAVQGAVTGEKEAIYQAVMMDPLTAAVLTLPEIHDMVDEMFEAEKDYLSPMK